MKTRILIFSGSIFLLWVFAIQNSFLFGLPFVHAGSDVSAVDRFVGEGEYSGDIGVNSNVLYFLRFYPLILATVNINQNVQGAYAGDNEGHNEVIHNVNWVRWTWTPCFDREYAVRQSLSQPDGEPYWHPDKPTVSLLFAFIPPVLLFLFLATKFRKFGNSVNSV